MKQSSKPFSANTLWDLPRTGNPTPSPDGRSALIPVTIYDTDTDKSTTVLHLWREGRRIKALTPEKAKSSDPTWAPDGKSFVYVQKNPEDNSSQLMLMDLDGGAPRQLTQLPLGAMNPQWFPDGKRILFVLPLYSEAPNLKATEKLKAENYSPKVRCTEDRLFRFWDHWISQGTIYHLAELNIDSQEIRDLTPTFNTVFDLMGPGIHARIHPNGKKIAFSALKSNPPFNYFGQGIFLLDLQQKGRIRKPKLISPSKWPSATRPEFSPDGNYLVYGVQKNKHFYADHHRLQRHDLKTHKTTPLAEDWDLSAGEWTFASSNKLIINVEEKGRSAVYSLNPTTKKPSLHKLWQAGQLAGLTSAGNRIFQSISNLNTPPEAFFHSLKDNKKKQLTTFTKEMKPKSSKVITREIWFKGHDGNRIQMFVLFPPGCKPGDRLRKAIHLIHGGPHGMFGDQWHWRWNARIFAEAGYVTCCVNFHGSSSYGQEFTQSILGRWGDQPYADIEAATNYLIEKGWVNPKKIAIAGGSYGGYLVSWITTQTDRYACAVNHAGVADLQSQFACDVVYTKNLSIGGSPWEGFEGLDRYNPMRHAQSIVTPTLVIHGEKDYRVPYSQGIEVYQILRAKQVPARLLFFEEENHWILKRSNSLRWYKEVLDWLKRWM